MAPSKVLVFHTRIEYNGLGRWKRKKDGPNQGRPFQLSSRTDNRNFGFEMGTLQWSRHEKKDMLKAKTAINILLF